MRPEISVIVPIFNEEESLPHLYARISESLREIGLVYEIVLVDDGSSDSSFQMMSDMADKDPSLVIVKFRQNAGQTAAMSAGIDEAQGRVLITMDGDLQNDPSDIPMMLSRLDEGFDLVVGWRIKRQDRWLSRKLPSKIANWLIGWVTGVPIRDNGCSLKVFRSEVVKRVPLYSDMHRFIPAMTVPYGARVAQVGVRHHARQFGESKYGLSRVYKVLLDLISISTLLRFARKPFALFLRVAMGFAMAAILTVCWVFVRDGSVTVPIIVAALFVVTSLFLVLLGTVVGLIHGREAALARSGVSNGRV